MLSRKRSLSRNLRAKAKRSPKALARVRKRRAIRRRVSLRARRSRVRARPRRASKRK